jgi:hypothetical protein
VGLTGGDKSISSIDSSVRKRVIGATWVPTVAGLAYNYVAMYKAGKLKLDDDYQ